VDLVADESNATAAVIDENLFMDDDDLDDLEDDLDDLDISES
jgi:hypothetical protein